MGPSRGREPARGAELRNQTIHPYTDLLLHDMGPGLADNMGEGEASGSEWRTPLLWGIENPFSLLSAGGHSAPGIARPGSLDIIGRGKTAARRETLIVPSPYQV